MWERGGKWRVVASAMFYAPGAAARRDRAAHGCCRRRFCVDERRRCLKDAMMQVYARMNALVQRYCDRELLFPELQAVVASLAAVGILAVVPPSTKVAMQDADT